MCTWKEEEPRKGPKSLQTALLYLTLETAHRSWTRIHALKQDETDMIKPHTGQWENTIMKSKIRKTLVAKNPVYYTVTKIDVSDGLLSLECNDVVVY